MNHCLQTPTLSLIECDDLAMVPFDRALGKMFQLFREPEDPLIAGINEVLAA